MPRAFATLPWLRRAAAVAARRHGCLALSIDTFAAVVWSNARRRVGQRPTALAIEEVARALVLADLHLATACDAGVDGAWDAFLLRLGPRIDAMARRHGASPAEAERIAADLPGELCQPAPSGQARTRLGAYDGTGSLEAWIEVVVARRVVDGIRKRTQRPETAMATEPVAADAGPADQCAADDDHRRFEIAFRSAWQVLSPREALAVRACHVDGVSQTAVATLLGVSQSSVSRLVATAVAKLRAHVGVATGAPPGSDVDPTRAAAAVYRVVRDEPTADSLHGTDVTDDPPPFAKHGPPLAP